MTRTLSAFAHSQHIAALVFVAVVALGPVGLPLAWSGNEIIYYDLAYRTVRPDVYGDAHSIFDGSNARIVGLALIGAFVEALGFEAAKTVLSLAAWALCALALASVARALNLRAAELGVALTLFILAGQSLAGGEWIIKTVETKVLAYICVLFALAAVLRNRWAIALVLLGMATLFHFLVGGAWAILFIALGAFLGAPRWASIQRLGLYAVVALPMVILLAREQFGTPPDLTGIDLTLTQIYAEFRASHHVAPFDVGPRRFFVNWLPGLCGHAMLVAAHLWIAPRSGQTPLHRWAAFLNGLLLVAFLVAFLDRDTHVFAKFLIFRPSSVTLLVSCLLLSATVMRGRSERVLNSALGVAAGLLLIAYAAQLATKGIGVPPNARLEAQMNEAEREVVRWIISETAPDARILIVFPSPSLGEGNPFPAGVERLSGRPLLVNFKSVPSLPQEIAHWYRMLQDRTALAEGDCTALTRLQPDYVIYRKADDLRVSDCVDGVHESADFIFATPR